MTDLNRKHWLGFDLGGTKMLALVFDENGRIVGKSRKKTKGYEGQKAGLLRIGNTIDEALQEAGLGQESLAGIGVGCPGPLDLAKGVIREAPNLGWTDVPIKQDLENRFQCPAIIANDVDSGVFGEYRYGAGRGSRCCVGVFPGTGIGGGCVYEGKIFQGANFSCMEVGHIPLVSEGGMDGFGNSGTLESVASRLAIAGLAAQACYRGQAPKLHERCGTSVGEIRSGALADSIESGDLAVEQIVRQASEYLGLGIVTLIHLLAPDTIILGGGLVEAMPDQFVKWVSEKVNDRVMPSYRGSFKIAAAELGDDATAKGAAAWAQLCLD